MTVDTSAIVAIVRAEPESQRCLDLMLVASTRRVSAGNLLEAYLVIDGGRDPRSSARLDAIIDALRLVVEPVTHEHAQIARDAFQRFGKGSGHGARLNFGGCFAYALARSRNEPLLFVGNDFSMTDITPAGCLLADEWLAHHQRPDTRACPERGLKARVEWGGAT